MDGARPSVDGPLAQAGSSEPARVGRARSGPWIPASVADAGEWYQLPAQRLKDFFEPKSPPPAVMVRDLFLLLLRNHSGALRRGPHAGLGGRGGSIGRGRALGRKRDARRLSGRRGPRPFFDRSVVGARVDARPRPSSRTLGVHLGKTPTL